MSTLVALRINDAAGRMATAVTRHSHLMPRHVGAALLDEVMALFALADEVSAEAERNAPGRPAKQRWWQRGRRASDRARMAARVEAVAPPPRPRLSAAQEVLAASRETHAIADLIGALAWPVLALPTSARARDRATILARVDEIAAGFGRRMNGAST